LSVYSKVQVGNESVINQVVGETLAELCKAKGLTQKQVGRLIGKKQSSVNKYFTGEIRMSFAMVYKLSKILEIEMSTIYDSVNQTLESGAPMEIPGPPDADI